MSRMFKGIYKVTFAALLMGVMLSGFSVSPATAELLKGTVQEENYRIAPPGGMRTGVTDGGTPMRISRGPAALKGSAVDSGAFMGQPGTPVSDSLRAGVVDTNEFAKAPKNFDIGAERGSREMQLAWERWHKQLSEAIYTRWQSMARDPGKATIRIVVTRSRTISAQIIRSSGGADFNDCIMSAIATLNRNPGLTFPAKSQRQQVSFEADYIAASNVQPGYSWVKNDVERVRESW